jgi:hypothetical protein
MDIGKTIKRGAIAATCAAALAAPNSATASAPNVTCREGVLIGTVVGRPQAGLPKSWAASPLRRGLARRGWGAWAGRRSGYVVASGIGS